MPLNPRWTSHIRDKEKQETFANAVLNSRVIVDRLRTIIEEEIKSIERSEANETYETPGWDYKQAHRNGYFRAMTLLLRLLDFTDKDKGPQDA